MEAGEKIIASEKAPAQDKVFYLNLLKTQFTKIGEMGFLAHPDMERDKRTMAALEKLDLVELQSISRAARFLLLVENSAARR